jgi:hypothetical protein
MLRRFAEGSPASRDSIVVPHVLMCSCALLVCLLRVKQGRIGALNRLLVGCVLIQCLQRRNVRMTPAVYVAGEEFWKAEECTGRFKVEGVHLV